MSGQPRSPLPEIRTTTQSALTPANVDPVPKTRTGYGDLRHGLLSAALGLAADFGSRALGASPLDALLIGTLVCLVRAVYSGLSDRRFDPIAWFLMLADAVTLAVGLCTQSPVLTMFGQHIPGVTFLVFVIGSLVVNRPFTQSLVSWLRPGWVQQHITDHRWNPADTQAYHRTQVRLTLAVIAAQTLHLAVASVVILILPVDVAKGALGVLALTTDVAVLGIAGRNGTIPAAPQALPRLNVTHSSPPVSSPGGGVA